VRIITTVGVWKWQVAPISGKGQGAPADNRRSPQHAGRSEGEPELRLCLVGSDAANDVIAAEVGERAGVAVQIKLLAEMVDELDGKTVGIDCGGAAEPILILSADDEGALGLVLPFAWVAQTTQAA
jgi:hypothetical protein